MAPEPHADHHVRLEPAIVPFLFQGRFEMYRVDIHADLAQAPAQQLTLHRQSVVELWRSGGIDTGRLWLFAYEDEGRAYLPRVRGDADWRDTLTDDIWLQKRRLITDVYGYGAESWEAQTTPREEGFWCFDSAQAAVKRAAFWEEQS